MFKKWVTHERLLPAFSHLHLAEHAHGRATEGCMLAGQVMANRVPGSLVFRVDGKKHSFNLKTTNLSHLVHHLSFANSDQVTSAAAAHRIEPSEVESAPAPCFTRTLSPRVARARMRRLSHGVVAWRFRGVSRIRLPLRTAGGSRVLGKAIRATGGLRRAVAHAARTCAARLAILHLGAISALA